MWEQSGHTQSQSRTAPDLAGWAGRQAGRLAGLDHSCTAAAIRPGVTDWQVACRNLQVRGWVAGSSYRVVRIEHVRTVLMRCQHEPFHGRLPAWLGRLSSSAGHCAGWWKRRQDRCRTAQVLASLWQKNNAIHLPRAVAGHLQPRMAVGRAQRNRQPSALAVGVASTAPLGGTRPSEEGEAYRHASPKNRTHTCPTAPPPPRSHSEILTCTLTQQIQPSLWSGSERFQLGMP